MKHNNKGFSLVELVAVLAIWAVMLGGTISIAGYMNGSKAKSAAYAIQSAIGKARTEAMSKSTGTDASNLPTSLNLKVKLVNLIIEQDSNGDYYLVIHSEDRKSGGDPESKVVREYLGNNRLKIYGGVTEINNETNPALYISFERDTGGMNTSPDAFNGITYITVKQGSVIYKVSFVRVTGKVSISKEYEKVNG